MPHHIFCFHDNFPLDRPGRYSGNQGVSLEGIQNIDSKYWDEGHDNSGSPHSPSKIGGGRHWHGRRKYLLPTWTLAAGEYCLLGQIDQEFVER